MTKRYRISSGPLDDRGYAREAFFAGAVFMGVNLLITAIPFLLSGARWSHSIVRLMQFVAMAALFLALRGLARRRVVALGRDMRETDWVAWAQAAILVGTPLHLVSPILAMALALVQAVMLSVIKTPTEAARPPAGLPQVSVKTAVLLIATPFIFVGIILAGNLQWRRVGSETYKVTMIGEPYRKNFCSSGRSSCMDDARDYRLTGPGENPVDSVETLRGECAVRNPLRMGQDVKVELWKTTLFGLGPVNPDTGETALAICDPGTSPEKREAERRAYTEFLLECSREPKPTHGPGGEPCFKGPASTGSHAAEAREWSRRWRDTH